MKVYGIVNCNTVKAARAWLDRRKLEYEFIEAGKTSLIGFDEAEYAKKLR